jgi:hypothetical protein
MQLPTTVVNDASLNMPGGDILLCVTVCCKLLVTQMLLKGFSNIDINGRDITTKG